MYCPHQYLSIDPNKVCHAHFNAHKLQKIVNMNAYISETIEERDLDSVALYAVKVCFAKMPRRLYRPQAAQICGANNFYAR